MTASVCHMDKHLRQSIMGVCLEAECIKAPKICSTCLQDNHSGHAIASFHHKQSKIYNLQINAKHTTHPFKPQIVEELSSLLEVHIAIAQKFMSMYASIQLTKQRCFDQHLLPMCKAIIDSFRQHTPNHTIQRILQLDIPEQQLSAIIRNITLFEKKHLSDIEGLLKSTHCMATRISSTLLSASTHIFHHLQSIEDSIQEWSVFGRDWEETLAMLEEEETIKEESKLKAKLNQQNQRIIKQQRLLIEHSIVYKWSHILQSIQTANPISHPSLNLQTHQLRNIPPINILTKLQHLTLSANQIRKIQNIQQLTNLLSLDISCNMLTKIQNIQPLVNLQTLRLNTNQICKIENIQQNTNLQMLRLGTYFPTTDNNAITKIDNVQSLKLLRYLDLYYNPLQRHTDNQYAVKCLLSHVKVFTYSFI